VPSLAGDIAIVSPHLDDAALSIGATIARVVREGAKVRIVTVLAGNATSEATAGSWDRACGFRTAGSAARARREEDRRACAALGAQPIWLPFNDGQYDRGGNDDQIWRELAPKVARADSVLVPGFPLQHEDHAWLTKLVTDRLDSTAAIGFFAEQPYAWRARHLPAVPSGPDGRALSWSRNRASLSERRAKGRACRAYWSQFRGRQHLERRFLVPEIFMPDELLGWPYDV
jgi:LmbE family N-acetylglucosaminyl deacetylase